MPKLAAVAMIALGMAQGCLGLSGTGPNGAGAADSGEPTSFDSGASTTMDAPAGQSPGDAASGADSSTPDAPSQTNGGDGSASNPDTGMQVAPDAGHPASDDAGRDAGPFASLVQLAITSFNANTVATTAMGGEALVAMDGHTLPTDGNDFATQSKVTSLGGTAGLPDDGVFPGNGATIPPLQFGWTNAANNENSLLFASNTNAAYAFNVPAGKSLGYFHTLQIYGAGTNGVQTLTYTLTYATGAAAMGTVTVADWCSASPLPIGTAKLFSGQRILTTGAALSDSDGFLCSIYAVNVTVDSSRVLNQISFTVAGAINSYLVLYGLAAW